MFQLYPIFEHSDVQEAYRKLNAFLAELAALDIHVPLDCVRANTKFYPDYQQTATTIEVAVEFDDPSVCRGMAQRLQEAHQRALSDGDVPAPAAEEKPVTVAAASDFDPFLDPDDMP